MSLADISTQDTPNTFEHLAQTTGTDQIEVPAWQGTAKEFGLAVPRFGTSALNLLGFAAASFPARFAANPALAMREYATDSTATSDAIFDVIDKGPGAWSRAMTPDPRTTGGAAQVVGGLTKGLLELGAGLGNPTVMAAMEGNDAARGLVEQGASTPAALGVGSLTAGASVLGVKVAPIGPNLLSKVATGTLGNVALGAAQRGGSAAILDASGSPQLAEQYKAFGGLELALDAGLGAFFGGAAHFLPSHADAALTVKNAKHFAEDTAPGIPADAAASAAHQDVLSQAMDQLNNGDPVHVDTARIADAEFVPRESQDILIEEGDMPEAIRQAFEDQAAQHRQDVSHIEGELGGHSIKSANGESFLQESGAYLIVKRDDTLKGHQGKGEGEARMLLAAELAQDRKLILASDTSVSPAEAAVFNKLAKRGYEVTRDPDAKINPETKNWAASDPRKPIFTAAKVKPEAATTKPAAIDEHPAVTQAREFATQSPDMAVHVGNDGDGNPIKTTMAEAMQQIEAEHKLATDESKAYEAAVTCFLRNG